MGIVLTSSACGYLSRSRRGRSGVFDSTSGESLAGSPAAGEAPANIALTPDGRTLLVTDAGMDTLSFHRPPSFLERDRLAVGRGPAGA